MLSRLTQFALICCAALAVSSCSSLKPYQAELKQGNFIRAEQVEQLDIGQTPAQVSFILGTPLITGEQPDARWVYPSYSQSTGYDTLIIEFENGLVSDIIEK